jgi:hypothetical protein
MQLVVRAFPVLPGREGELRALADELRTTRAGEASEFFRRMGAARESWHLQQTPQGPWLIAVTQIPERPVQQVGREYAESSQPFDSWLKRQVGIITGVDPDATPLGPPTECIFDLGQT